MGVHVMLEWVSNLTQLGAGALALWAAWHLRKLPEYRWPLIGVGICLLFTGIVGLFNIGSLAAVNWYRRPLFIIERTLSAYVFFQVVVRNKRLAMPRVTDDD